MVSSDKLMVLAGSFVLIVGLFGFFRSDPFDVYMVVLGLFSIFEGLFNVMRPKVCFIISPTLSAIQFLLLGYIYLFKFSALTTYESVIYLFFWLGSAALAYDLWRYFPVRKAYDMFNRENYPEALSYYEKALKRCPKDVSVWAGKGAVLCAMEQCNEALNCFDKALKLDPNSVLALTCKSIALDDLKRYGEALNYCDKALELKTNDESIWLHKIDILNELKKFDEVLKCLDKVLELGPDNIKVLHSKGCSYGSWGV